MTDAGERARCEARAREIVGWAWVAGYKPFPAPEMLPSVEDELVKRTAAALTALETENAELRAEVDAAHTLVRINEACRESAEKECDTLKAEVERLRAATSAEAVKVIEWAQAVLTALNVGDVQRESLIHKKLREVMIAYRAVEPTPTPEGRDGK